MSMTCEVKISRARQRRAVKLAREQYEDEGHIEIDDDAKVSVAPKPDERDEGYYVSGWLWVHDPRSESW